MTPAIRITLILAVLLISSSNLNGQNDSLVIDSITGRINEILDEYNSYSVFIDTSEYVHDDYEADNINLQIAASVGACNEIIRLFVRGADINNFSGSVARPLHYAVSSSKWEAVEILLLLGADPEKEDMYGNTPLITAVRANYPVIAEKLIRYGASVSKADRYGYTPLHHAASLGNLEMADMLLYYDSNIESQDKDGNSPLMTGVCYGYSDIADLLLQSGADPNTRDRKGFTPLMAASQNGDTLIMSLLIDAGANLYAVNNEGADALGCAVISSAMESAEFLLDKGNRWNTSGKSIASAVNLANIFGRYDILKMLQDRGIDGKRLFSFNELAFSATGLFTPVYMMAGGVLSMTEPGIRTGLTLGINSNPLKRSILTQGDDDIYYQYRFKSTLIHTGFFREFRLNRQTSDFSIKVIPSLSFGYMFHSKFEGTEEHPEDSFSLIPGADLGIGFKSMGLSAGVSYFKTPFYRVGPLWFALRTTYTFSRPARNFSIKKVRSYIYE
jgi:ankyrin repeat protein